MFYYRMYGLLVCSEIEIKAGYPENEGQPDVIVRMIRPDETMPEVHVVDREYGVIRLADNTYFLIKNGSEIIIKSNDKTDWFKATQFIATECLPAILFQRGIFTIHGSCIEIMDGSVVITGASGAGKSSLASEFFDAGYKLMADDTVGLSVDENGVYTIPAFPQRKLVGYMAERMGLDKAKLIDLGEDKPKYAINVDSQFCTQKRQFKALVQVCKYQGETVEIEEVTGAEKLRFLMNTSYEYMLYANDKLHKNEIVEMVKICNEVPFYMVLRPETGYTTKEQMKLIITKL